jgi:hypothetical protein
VLEKGVLLSEATRALPGYKTSFFSGRPQYVLTIGAEFVILQAMDVWTFSINLKTMEVAPAVQDTGLLVYGCELPCPPTIPEHFQSGPARPAHGSYWTGLGSDLAAREKNLGPSPVRNVVFSYFAL